MHPDTAIVQDKFQQFRPIFLDVFLKSFKILLLRTPSLTKESTWAAWYPVLPVPLYTALQASAAPIYAPKHADSLHQSPDFFPPPVII
jgi:hypothetical protein